MPKKKGKRKKGKKNLADKSPEEIYMIELTATVAERMKREIWDVQDSEMKKKLTKKDRVRLAQRRGEELKVAVELERLRLIEEEKKRQEEERKAAIEKEIRDKVEQGMRIDQLGETCGYIEKLRLNFLASEIKFIADTGWDQYLKCDGLPDPSNCGEMNTYLHIWDKTKEQTTIDQARTKSQEVLSLLDTLDSFLDCPAISDKQKAEWLMVRNSFRTYQQYNLDCAAYRLLRNIDGLLKRNDIPTATYVIVDQYFTICLWVLIQLPIPNPNPKRPERPPTSLTFTELSMDIAFPESIDVWALCVRAMYISYDHYSYMCHTYKPPPIPEELLLDLNEVTKYEWIKKLEARADAIKALKEAYDVEVAAAMKAAAAVAEEGDIVKIKPIKQAFVKIEQSAIYVGIEDTVYASYRAQLQTIVPENEINLRRYRIIGGIFFLDLFFQPPQPTTMVLKDITIATLQIPKWLYDVPFRVNYIPPPDPEPGVTREPQEIEADIKLQESEYEKLIFITLSLPSTVLWLDVPIVCQWDAEQKIWSTENIHDMKHNEEKQTVQFRTGKFAPFAMALYKYSSMPYQAWEIKPAPEGRVVLTIIAAVLVIEFTVKKSLVCVSQLQNAPNAALNSILGVYVKLPKLKRILRKAGVDVFPAHDAFCYTDGVCEKQWPMEHHLYYNMAQCSLFYNFAWSRWNLLAGRRTAVMQMREWSGSERIKLPNYAMLMVNPLKALIVDCSEVSAEFVEEGIAKMKFYPDLYHLVVGMTSISMKQKLHNAPLDVVNTVGQLLNVTRILSFS